MNPSAKSNWSITITELRRPRTMALAMARRVRSMTRARSEARLLIACDQTLGSSTLTTQAARRPGSDQFG